jgi:hypothetical protein
MQCEQQHLLYQSCTKFVSKDQNTKRHFPRDCKKPRTTAHLLGDEVLVDHAGEGKHTVWIMPYKPVLEREDKESPLKEVAYCSQKESRHSLTLLCKNRQIQSKHRVTHRRIKAFFHSTVGNHEPCTYTPAQISRTQVDGTRIIFFTHNSTHDYKHSKNKPYNEGQTRRGRRHKKRQEAKRGKGCLRKTGVLDLSNGILGALVSILGLHQKTFGSREGHHFVVHVKLFLTDKVGMDILVYQTGHFFQQVTASVHKYVCGHLRRG